MQRKPTSNTRGPNSQEKAFQGYTKACDCIVCGNPGPGIVHHCMGSTFRQNKVLIGHWFVLPLCQICDDVVTHQSRRAFTEKFGKQSLLFDKHRMNYYFDTDKNIPEEVTLSILTSNQ